MNYTTSLLHWADRPVPPEVVGGSPAERHFGVPRGIAIALWERDDTSSNTRKLNCPGLPATSECATDRRPEIRTVLPARNRGGFEWRKPGFTLIELLVVIAIIGILAGLLLPVLGRAKDTAIRTMDLANLKQMMVATHLYAGENQDTMPWPNWASGDQPGRPGWLYAASGNWVVPPPGQSPFKVATGLFWPVIHDPRVYFCPRDDTNSPRFLQRVQQISSYAMNGAVCGYTNVLYPSVKEGRLDPTSIIFWETDETMPSDFNDGANYPSEGVSRRHDQGGIFGAAAGSVGYIKYVEWYAEEADTNKNRLWCYPGSPNGR
jgi:prepilin-type N-terminal cleavage/methylation domain-containing protein